MSILACENLKARQSRDDHARENGNLKAPIVIYPSVKNLYVHI